MTSGVGRMYDDYERYKKLCERFGEPMRCAPSSFLPYGMDLNHLSELEARAALST